MKPILHVWTHSDQDLVDVTITSTTSSHQGKTSTTTTQEKLHTTSEHPFLTAEYGFVPAGQLKVGMHVLRADGTYGVVTEWQVVPGTQVMYNLEVAQDHTFTVGDGQFVVHNKCNPRDLERNLSNAGQPRPDGNHNPHHIIPCATLGSNASADARDLVSLAQQGGFDINGAENGRWLWNSQNRQAAMMSGEPWHANNPAYQQFVEGLLEYQYQSLLNSGSLSPTSAYAAVQSTINTLNTVIDAIGQESLMSGTPCSLAGF